MTWSIFSALLVPFVAGFLFLRGSWMTAYEASKTSRPRLVCYATLVGAMFLVFAAFLVSVLEPHLSHLTDPLVDDWEKLGLPTHDHAGIIILGLALPVLASGLLNVSAYRHAYLTDTAFRFGKSIEFVLLQAIGTAVPVELRTRDRRWYVGFPVAVSLRDDSDVALIPLLAGTVSDQGEKQATASYGWPAVMRARDDGNDGDIPSARAWQIALPRAQIVHAEFFRPESSPARPYPRATPQPGNGR